MRITRSNTTLAVFACLPVVSNVFCYLDGVVCRSGEAFSGEADRVKSITSFPTARTRGSGHSFFGEKITTLIS